MFCQGNLSNPYPLYHRLREKDPVHFSQDLKTWLITCYEDVMADKCGNRLSSARMDFYLKLLPSELINKLGSLTNYMSRWMSMTDPPDHTRLRGLVSVAFSPPRIEELAARIQIICDTLIDSFSEKGHADLINDFSYLLPATVISELLGIPSSDQLQLRKRSRPPTRCGASSKESK